jgi:hypothetical protein
LENKSNTSKSRLTIGMIILIVGFISPVLIPFVAKSSLSIGFKTAISGLLAFGIPEVFMLIAIGVMGKPGYDLIKTKFLKYFKFLNPPETVSPARHKIGITMFWTPIILGIFIPYLGYFFEGLSHFPIYAYIISDAIFILSFFVLGGEFWDKFRLLFVQGVAVEEN